MDFLPRKCGEKHINQNYCKAWVEYNKKTNMFCVVLHEKEGNNDNGYYLESIVMATTG